MAFAGDLWQHLPAQAALVHTPGRQPRGAASLGGASMARGCLGMLTGSLLPLLFPAGAVTPASPSLLGLEETGAAFLPPTLGCHGLGSEAETQKPQIELLFTLR